MSEETIIPFEPSLPIPTEGGVTAEQINEAHERVVSKAREFVAAQGSVLLAAMACGSLLIAKKLSLAHGEWLPWLAANCPQISEDTGEIYRLLAANSERVRNLIKLDPDTSLRTCLATLREERKQVENLILPALPNPPGNKSSLNPTGKVAAFKKTLLKFIDSKKLSPIDEGELVGVYEELRAKLIEKGLLTDTGTVAQQLEVE